MIERVKTIKSVTYVFERSNPPNLIVTVEGEVPTAGWKNAQLLPRVYMKDPDDKMWELDLLAQAPETPAAEVMSVVKASFKWTRIDPASVAGVRVYGVNRGIKEIEVKA